MRRLIAFSTFIAFVALAGIVYAQAQQQEEVTLTTYYPAPYGSYQGIVATDRIGIGTGITGLGGPQASLHISTPNANAPLAIFESTGATAGAIFRVKAGPGDPQFLINGNGSIGIGTPPIPNLSISTIGGARFGGRVGIGVDPNPVYDLTTGVSINVAGTVFPPPSDARFKENIVPLSGVLDKLDNLRAVTFDWNQKYRETWKGAPGRQIGVIAQEVEKVFPELVTKSGPEGYYAVDYMRFSAVLLEAVKELSKENAELKSRVAALEKKVR